MTAELDLSVSSKALSSEPNRGFSVLYNKLASQISSPSSSVSREMNSVLDAINPQGLSVEKPPSSSNVKSATSPPNSHPKPLTLQATEPADEDPRAASQPTTEELAKLGIKVRDFAYESELPPIRPYRRPVRQVQPGPRPLKRMRLDEGEGEDFSHGNSSGMAWGQSSDAKELLPIDTSNLPRTRGFADLNSYDHLTDSQPLPHSQQSEWSSPSHSQPPLEYIDSQSSEPYISTPLVTPNGSLQWQVKDTSSIPASQLDINPPLSESEHVTEPKPLLGRSLPSERDHLSSPQGLMSDLDLPQLSSPRSGNQSQRHFSLSPSPALLDGLPPPKKKQRSEPSASLCPPKSSSPPPDVSASPSPRYHLRSRRATSSQSPPKPGSRRSHPPSRSQKNGKLAPPPAGPFSVRSAHSQSPKKSQESKKPRARKKG